MVTKKLFALASVSALAGLVTTVTAAGCSTTTTETTTGDAGNEGGKTTPKREAGPAEEAGPEVQCPSALDFTYADMAKEFGWKPAKTIPGSCTEDDFTQIETNLKSATKVADITNGLTDDCKACVATKDTADNLSVLVEGTPSYVNFGACASVVESAECGEAIQYYQFCLQIACECATSSGEAKCNQEAVSKGGPCEEWATKQQENCPNYDSTIDTCGTLVGGAKIICGAAETDGGTDAKAD
jgi:hypothetical protein